MWSMHDFPILTPACSWRRSLSTAVVMRWRLMRQNTMLVMNSSVMPLQLLHSDRFPSFWSLMIVPSPSVGYHFIIPDVLSTPGALPFFSFLIAS